MMFRSRAVSCRIGSSPSSSIHPEQVTGDSLTVAAWLSVTLAASTTSASARAVSRTGSGSGSAGGPTSAVTTNFPDASASASIRQLRGGEFVFVSDGDRPGGRLARSGEHDDVRALAVGERLEPGVEAALARDLPEQRTVEPVDDRSLKLARAAEARVLIDLAHEEVLQRQHPVGMQEVEGLGEALDGHRRQ